MEFTEGSFKKRMSKDGANEKPVKSSKHPGEFSWRCSLRYRDDGEGWNQASTNIWAKTEKEARKLFKEWRAAKIAEIENRKPHEKTPEEIERERRASETVSEYVEKYITYSEKTARVEPSTIAYYRVQQKRVDRYIGDVKLEGLTYEMGQQWVLDLMDYGLTPTTVTKSLKFLKAVYAHAVETKRLTDNPLKALKPPKAVRKKPNALNSEQRTKLAKHLEESPLGTLTVAVSIALYTGMRVGEICALQWRDVDFERGEIHVTRAIGTSWGGTYEKDTKTGVDRHIPLGGHMRSILDRWRRHAEEEALMCGVPFEGTHYVIGKEPACNGEYSKPMTISRKFEAVSEFLGLIGTQNEKVTFHDLRHTFATHAIASGMDVKSVSSILGHANAAMTLNIYASPDPDAMRRTIEAVEAGMMTEPKQAEIVELQPTGTEG